MRKEFNSMKTSKPDRNEKISIMEVLVKTALLIIEIKEVKYQNGNLANEI